MIQINHFADLGETYNQAIDTTSYKAKLDEISVKNNEAPQAEPAPFDDNIKWHCELRRTD